MLFIPLNIYVKITISILEEELEVNWNEFSYTISFRVKNSKGSEMLSDYVLLVNYFLVYFFCKLNLHQTQVTLFIFTILLFYLVYLIILFFKIDF